MKLGIAARQPADVGVLGRGFVHQRREEIDLRAAVLPAHQNVRVEKRKGGVAGDGDALAGWLQRRGRRSRRGFQRRGERENGPL